MKTAEIKQPETIAGDAWRDCGRCSDEYYRALTEWTVSLQAEGVASVERLALAYEKSLDIFLKCLSQVPGSIKVEHERTLAKLYLSLVASEIRYLRTIRGKASAARRTHSGSETASTE